MSQKRRKNGKAYLKNKQAPPAAAASAAVPPPPAAAAASDQPGQTSKNGDSETVFFNM